MEKMMMPAYYNVLSTEEMTYTEGGANATMTEALLCWLIPPYGWFRGVTAVSASACFVLWCTPSRSYERRWIRAGRLLR